VTSSERTISVSCRNHSEFILGDTKSSVTQRVFVVTKYIGNKSYTKLYQVYISVIRYFILF